MRKRDNAHILSVYCCSLGDHSYGENWMQEDLRGPQLSTECGTVCSVSMCAQTVIRQNGQTAVLCSAQVLVLKRQRTQSFYDWHFQESKVGH